jgi:hypothetical protein
MVIGSLGAAIGIGAALSIGGAAFAATTAGVLARVAPLREDTARKQAAVMAPRQPARV